jgi:DNA repair exonuclease SbcCD nuclease subunit
MIDNFFKEKKIAIFTDIHIGVHRDSPVWHQIALDWVDWFTEQVKQHNIKNILFCGDFFHNRSSVDLTTLQTGAKIIEKLKDFNLLMIAGNHDSYYKNNASVNSLSPFKGKKNIFVVDDQPLQLKDKIDICLCPWGTELDSIPNCDLLIGHFEIQNFKMNHFKVCDHGLGSDSILDKANLIISGHFHLREHRKYPNGKSILYLGSPYEMDFGERGQIKGFHILNTETLNVQFIENNNTPKHIKIKVSDLLTGNIKKEELPELLKNNFIAIDVDKKMDTQTLDLIISKFAQHQPKHVRTDFNIFEQMQLSATETEEFSFDIDKALQEFVELIDTTVPKKEILDKCLEFYKLSLVQNE